jgi:hypothetical protein
MFEADPADDDYQRGFQGALEVVLEEAVEKRSVYSGKPLSKRSLAFNRLISAVQTRTRRRGKKNNRPPKPAPRSRRLRRLRGDNT